MADLYDKVADLYIDARPRYPSQWFSMLTALTPYHLLAWDVGTGNGQAATTVAEHYDRVIATDISEVQLKHAMSHPQVQYFHTPLSMPDDELVALFGGENSVDLITAATAVHWFDMDKFYSLAKRLLRKPGGIIAVWTYNIMEVNPEFDALAKDHFEKYLEQFQNPKVKLAYDCYKTIPFPFESVGIGCEGQPFELDMSKEMSFEGVLRMWSTGAAYNAAKEQGVDFMSEEVMKKFEDAWGGSELVRTVNYKTYMHVGKVKL